MQLALKDFKENMNAAFDQVHDTSQTLEVVDANGRVTVMMDGGVYQDRLKELGLMKAILQGELELKEGRGLTHEQVMAEMSDLLG